MSSPQQTINGFSIVQEDWSHLTSERLKGELKFLLPFPLPGPQAEVDLLVYHSPTLYATITPSNLGAAEITRTNLYAAPSPLSSSDHNGGN